MNALKVSLVLAATALMGALLAQTPVAYAVPNNAPQTLPYAGSSSSSSQRRPMALQPDSSAGMEMPNGSSSSSGGGPNNPLPPNSKP